MPLDAGEGASGGGGAAAGTFKVLGQHETPLIQGANTVVNGMQITVQENTYAVVFSFTIPYAEWQADGTRYWAELYAGWVQAMGADDDVVGMYYAQDVNASGNLIDTMFVTVGTPDGLNTATVQIALANLNTEASFGKVHAAYAQLQKTLALT
jgi:hypothetical protein